MKYVCNWIKAIIVLISVTKITKPTVMIFQSKATTYLNTLLPRCKKQTKYAQKDRKFLLRKLFAKDKHFKYTVF